MSTQNLQTFFYKTVFIWKYVFLIYNYTCLNPSFYSVAIIVGKINIYYFLVIEQIE